MAYEIRQNSTQIRVVRGINSLCKGPCYMHMLFLMLKAEEKLKECNIFGGSHRFLKTL